MSKVGDNTFPILVNSMPYPTNNLSKSNKHYTPPHYLPSVQVAKGSVAAVEEPALGIAGGGCSWGWRGEDVMLS